MTVSTDANRKEVSKRANQRGPITEAKGWLETLYAEWKPVDGAEAYHVYVKGGQYSEYNRVDAQLVREYKDYFRVDVPGLKSGTY